MGAVYEATQLDGQRRVAVKVLHPHVARCEKSLQRFAQEAKIAAEIGHLNIAPVYDASLSEARPFLVMALLEGETLAERMAAETPVAVDEAVAIAGYILSALASAHARGVVHRDLKPANVFLVAGEGPAGVRLLDFGVSKARGSEKLLETTQEGVTVGTPGAMAPEQWLGRRDVDARVDLFAVGVLLYTLLTGVAPYQGETQGELFLEVVRGEAAPMRPSMLRGGVAPGLDAAVLRALQRDRGRRFPTARAFLEALRPYGAEGIAVTEALAPTARPEGAYEGPLGATLDDAVPTRRPSRSWGALAAVAGLVLAVAASTRVVGRGASAAVPPRAQLGAVARGAASAPSRVRLSVRGLAPSATLRLDGAPVEGAAWSLVRDGAEHTLEITAGGARERVTVVADRDQTVVLTAPSEASPPPPAPAQTAASPRRPHRRHGPSLAREF